MRSQNSKTTACDEGDDHHRAIDSFLKKYIVGAAVGITLTAIGGLVAAARIQDDVEDLKKQSVEQQEVNKQVIVNTQAMQDIKDDITEIKRLVEKIDERQRIIMQRSIHP